MYKDLQNLMGRHNSLHFIIKDIIIAYKHYKDYIKHGSNVVVQMSRQWTYENVKMLTGARWALGECKVITQEEALALDEFEAAMRIRLGYWA